MWYLKEVKFLKLKTELIVVKDNKLSKIFPIDSLKIYSKLRQIFKMQSLSRKQKISFN